MARSTFKHPLLCWVALTFVTGGVIAQTQPDAGALRQQIEQGRELGLPHKVLPEKPAEPPAMAPLTGVVITVKSFQFAGNTLITSETLAPVVDGFLNRPLDYAQLQAATMAVAKAYREAGWIVRVYLPQQDITDGIVTLQIVEALFGGVKFEGDPSKRIANEQLQLIFDERQPKGVPLNADALDRALLLADDIPGVSVAGSLRPGTGEGETDIVLKLTEEPLVAWDVGFDNTGARSTGSNRVTANVTLNSALGMGDLVTGNLLHTQGTDYGRLGFTAPVGAAGWRVGANASLLSYKILTEFSASNLTGTSDTQGLEASYPLIRSRLKNLFLNLNYDSKHFDNKSTQATESHYSVDSTTIALNGNLFDNLGGGGATNSSVALILGNVALGTLDQGETASLNGSFSKLRYALSRQQVITDNVYLYVNLSGQQSNKNLDSSEKIYLGGVNGVRAYPSNEGGGSSGNVANVELRWQLPWDMSITGFYDVGHISNYGGSPSYSLQGGGLSLARHFANGANIKGTWAHRIGDNPNPTSTGNDQDGSLQKNRFWLTAGVPF